MKWLFGKIKTLLKWVFITVGVLTAIVIIIAVVVSNDSEQEQSQEPSTSAVEPVSYEIVEEDDTSVLYDGEMAKRKGYRVVVGTEIDRDQVEPTVRKIISDITAKDDEIDSIHLYLYSTESRANGLYDIAMAEWAPDGNVGNLTGRIAKNNIRDNYEIDLEIKEDLEDYLNKITSPEERFGFTEEGRKEIFRELVRCEDKGDVRSAKYYDPNCEACPEYRETEDWMAEMGEKMDEIIKACEAEVRQEYGITEDQEDEISIEGMEESWPMPEMPPYPDCCDY